MLDKTKPLWLPEGSVRAIMGLTVIASTFGRALVGHELPAEQLAVGTGVPLAYGAWRGAQAAIGGGGRKSAGTARLTGDRSRRGS